MFLSTGLKRVRLLGMGTHFFPKNLARGMLIRVGTFIRDTIVIPPFHKRSCIIFESLLLKILINQYAGFFT